MFLWPFTSVRMMIIKSLSSMKIYFWKRFKWNIISSRILSLIMKNLKRSNLIFNSQSQRNRNKRVARAVNSGFFNFYIKDQIYEICKPEWIKQTYKKVEIFIQHLDDRKIDSITNRICGCGHLHIITLWCELYDNLEYARMQND